MQCLDKPCSSEEMVFMGSSFSVHSEPVGAFDNNMVIGHPDQLLQRQIRLIYMLDYVVAVHMPKCTIFKRQIFYRAPRKVWNDSELSFCVAFAGIHVDISPETFSTTCI
jgi:hypothetical protein